MSKVIVRFDGMGRPMCSARNSSEEGYCRSIAVCENGRCKFHGGKAPKGRESGRFKVGRYSRYLPDRLQEKYDVAESDTDLHRLDAEIALMDSRIAELVESLSDTENSVYIAEAKEAFEDFELAQAARSVKDTVEALDRVKRNLFAAHDQQETWNKLITYTDNRRKLVLAETKRQGYLQQYIPVSQMMAFIKVLMNTIKENVKDETARHRIEEKLLQLTGGSES